MRVCIVVCLVLLLMLTQTAIASEQKLIDSVAIRTEPVDILRYVDGGIDYLAEILARLMKTGKPALLFNNGARAGAEVTVAEDTPWKNFNIVAGMTIVNEEVSQFFWGVEYEVTLVGGMWEMFKRFRPGVYSRHGGVYLGFGFELRPETEE